MTFLRFAIEILKIGPKLFTSIIHDDIFPLSKGQSAPIGAVVVLSMDSWKLYLRIQITNSLTTRFQALKMLEKVMASSPFLRVQCTIKTTKEKT
jgi:hypothetical protein